MLQASNHALDLWAALDGTLAADLMPTQSAHRLAHASLGADDAADEPNFYHVGHVTSLLGRLWLGRATANLRDLFHGAKLTKRLERRLHQVMRIRRAQPLGQDVTNSRQLDDRAHSTRRDNSGPFRRRLKDHLAGAEMSQHFMRDGAFAQRYLNQAFLGAFDALTNRLGHFVGLAEPESDHPVMFARHHQRRKAETASALNHLGNAVDVDDFFFYFETLRVNPIATATAIVALRHEYCLSR